MEQFNTFEQFLDQVERDLKTITPNEQLQNMATALRQGGWIDLAEKVEAEIEADTGESQ